MATQENKKIELSESASKIKKAFWKEMRIYIVVSRWNYEITHKLYQAACQTLIEKGIKKKNISTYFVPGAFELPITANMILSADNQPDGMIAIGSVIKGETPHFEYVCQGVTYGLQKVMTDYNTHISFCVLTDNNIEQAKERAGGKYGNKGIDAAITCLEMIAIKYEIE